MGVFSAMTTAITGLRVQSNALEYISNNIANSKTTGYKRTDTTFADLLPTSPPRQQASGVVNAFSRPTNNIQGDISSYDTDTFMAINGDGYFIVGEQIDNIDGTPIFSDEDLFTRRGDFEINKDGYLVNAAGYFLKGLTIDQNTGNPSGSLPEVLRINNDFLAANPTTRIDYRANLASYPLTATSDPNVTGSELLGDATNYVGDPATTGIVESQDAATFISRSIAGGAITGYTSAGTPVNVQLRWAKVANADAGPPVVEDTWNLFYLADSDPANPTDTAWQSVGVDYTFDSNGAMSSATGTVNVANLTVDGVDLGNVQFSHGSDGITQFADPNGGTKVTEIAQNGYGAGELTEISVTEEGRIVANYSNGRVIDIAEVTLAAFNADGFLAKVDGGSFRKTADSGEPILGAQGRVVGSALEDSNTDIADEFSKLIITQQAYAANTRIVSTGDEMIQEVLNMVR